ncbi:PP2C family protein-serine/threonine phosphatase, partial [Petrachloros mirabilis]
MFSTNSSPRLIHGFCENPGANGKPMEDASDYFLAPASSDLGGQVSIVVVAESIEATPSGGNPTSRLAIQTIKDYFAAHLISNPNQSIAAAMEAAHQAIIETKNANNGLTGVGSTATVAILTADRVFIGSAGDCRAYVLGSKGVKRLTEDHTWVQEALDTHRISVEEAKVHPNRHAVRRYLGMTGQFSPDIRPTELIDPGDAILLCTDGLTDVVDDSELIVDIKEPGSAAMKLVALALKRRTSDNVTARIVKISSSASSRKVGRATIGTLISSARGSQILPILLMVSMLLLAATAIFLGLLLPRSTVNPTPVSLEVAGIRTVASSTTQIVGEFSDTLATVTPMPTFTPLPPTPKWT